ncbi:MAG: hypothetical protein FHK80_15885 [Azoarcus sp. PHD]|nr:MAG: hypothetical protein FHK80_15885 [Azoarcus sp. PHD]
MDASFSLAECSVLEQFPRHVKTLGFGGKCTIYAPFPGAPIFGAHPNWFDLLYCALFTLRGNDG